MRVSLRFCCFTQRNQYQRHMCADDGISNIPVGGGSIRRIDARFIAATLVGRVEKRSNLVAFSPPQTYLSVTGDVIPTRPLLCSCRLLLQHVCNGSMRLCRCLYGRIRSTCAQDKNLCTRIREPFFLP